MELCIHRGARQIGGSCVEIVSSGRSIIIDMGLPLDAEGDTAQYLPELFQNSSVFERIDAVIISHPHPDHYGLAAHLPSGIPVIMGEHARNIVQAASIFMKNHIPLHLDGPNLRDRAALSAGPFSITPYLADHSGYDAYALLIEAEGKRIFYSGDFRAHGRKSRLTERIIGHPPKNIDLLLLEGSSLRRVKDTERFETEETIEEKLLTIMKEARGMTLVHTSAQNIDRLVSIFRACRRAGKIFVMDLYAAAICAATGNSSIPQSEWEGVALFIPQRQRVQIKNNKWFDLLKKHDRRRIFADEMKKDPSRYVVLFRPIHIADLEKEGLAAGCDYVYSQWEGYQSKDSFAQIQMFLERNCIDQHRIHTSGHADIPSLMSFAEALSPGKIVPIHTFEPERYRELFSNVEIIDDGKYYTV